jgi:hypothetical protein
MSAALSLDHRTIEGDCLDLMRTMDDDSVDLVVTSPPYENARSYGIDFKLKGEEWVAGGHRGMGFVYPPHCAHGIPCDNELWFAILRRMGGEGMEVRANCRPDAPTGYLVKWGNRRYFIDARGLSFTMDVWGLGLIIAREYGGDRWVSSCAERDSA